MIVKPGPRQYFSFCLGTDLSESDAIIRLDSKLRNLRDEGQEIDWNFYIPFGLSDVLLEVNGFLWEQFLPRLDHVKRFSSLRVFRVATGKLVTSNQSALYALVFFKLNETLPMRERRNLADETLFHRLVEDHPVLQRTLERAELFVSLGWHELVAAISIDDFEQLSLFLNACTSLSSHHNTPEGCGVIALFQSSVSIAMVRCRAKDPKKEPVPVAQLPDVVASGSVYVDVCPGKSMSKIAHEIECSFDCKPRFLLGSEDLAVNFQDLPVSDLFSKIIRLRNGFSGEVYGTRTVLNLPAVVNGDPDRMATLTVVNSQETQEQ